VDGATLLGHRDPKVIEDLESGVAGIDTRDGTDRIRCILEIYTIVNRLLRDPAAEKRWIRESRPELNNRSLIQVMLSGGLEDLILAREFVEELTGR
jgi:hypothetical protein